MLTILYSSQTGMQARQTLERTPPTWASILSSIDQLLGLAAADIGLRFVVRDDQLDRPAVDAARFVDAVDRHLHADQCRLADDRGGARQRLHRADLVGLGRAESGPATAPARALRRARPRSPAARRPEPPGAASVCRSTARHSFEPPVRLNRFSLSLIGVRRRPRHRLRHRRRRRV